MNTTLTFFEIIARSDEQKADAGWYYRVLVGAREVGEPQGPFPSIKVAQRAYNASKEAL